MDGSLGRPYADLYLEAIEAEAGGHQPSRPWALAFGAPSGLPQLYHVMLGMNAHVNYDLPQALLAVTTDEEFDDPVVVALRQADHRGRDRAVARRLGACDDWLVSVSGPGSVLNRLLRPLNRGGSQRILREAHDHVWANSIALSRARRSGRQAYADVLADLEELTAAKVAKLRASDLMLVRVACGGFCVRLSSAAL